MYSALHNYLTLSIKKLVPATGIGLLRFFYGLVTFQEIVFLLYFRHLIFDPIPFLDVEFPMIPFFLCLWGIVTIFLTLGYRCQFSAISCYIFWIIFVNFTPMQRDFDGGFDTFMIGAGFFLMFLPIDRAFSIDNLRTKLLANYFTSVVPTSKNIVILCYQLPVIICLGFLYFDSAIHKLFAEHWRNGLGAWLPSSLPYYISAIDMTGLLNNETLQKSIGYTILVFQFTFIFLCFKRRFNLIYIIIGLGLHIGITLTFNIYPFGLAMLSFYCLLIPISWWKKLNAYFASQKPKLTVLFDEQCPLCNRTAILIDHFDILNVICFKGLQTHASNFEILSSIDNRLLLTDLYAIDDNNRLFSGLDTYIQIFYKMVYTAPLGWILRLPGLYNLATRTYRKIADNRQRNPCSEACITPNREQLIPATFYTKIFENYAQQKPFNFVIRFKKILIIFLLLQLNSTIHYGIIYRLKIDTNSNLISSQISSISNSIILLTQTFLGITPHALYLHDHFEGYNDIFAITYLDRKGNEKWLPFVNTEGRLLAPNWGRVHSMWANIAVTPHINNHRFEKFVMKVTAFWGTKVGLSLLNAHFIIKHKKIQSPSTWQLDLLKHNLSGTWQDIGHADWLNNNFSINIPDLSHIP